MKIADLKQPYRRMAEYLGDENNTISHSLSNYFFRFYNKMHKGENPEITEEIKKYFPPDFDFSGEKGFVYPYDKNYLKIPINEHSTLLIPKDDLMEKTSNEEKIVYWAKNLEHKSLSLHELVEEGKWLVSHCSNIEDNKQYYTQLAKEGKFDELPDTCEFSMPVTLEVFDKETKMLGEKWIVGKFRGRYVSSGFNFYLGVKLPTQKIDFSEFKNGDVVEVETKDNSLFLGYFLEEKELNIDISYAKDKRVGLYPILKEFIKSITKIK